MMNKQLEAIYITRLRKYKRLCKSVPLVLYAVITFVVLDGASRLTGFYTLNKALDFAALAQKEALNVQHDPGATEEDKKEADRIIKGARETELYALQARGHLWLAVGFSLALMAGVFAWHLNRSTVLTSNVVIRKGPIANLGSLSSIAEPICHKLGLVPAEVRVEITLLGSLPYASLSADRQPSLYMPTSLLALTEDRKEEFAAILAHEMAHLKHRDLKFWPLSIFLSRYILPFACAFYGGMLTVRESIDLLLPVAPLIWPVMAAFAVFFWVCQMRKESEYMADLAAAVVVGVDPIRNGIRDLIKDNEALKPREFDEPATKDERLRKLDAIIADSGAWSRAS